MPALRGRITASWASERVQSEGASIGEAPRARESLDRRRPIVAMPRWAGEALTASSNVGGSLAAVGRIGRRSSDCESIACSRAIKESIRSAHQLSELRSGSLRNRHCVRGSGVEAILYVSVLSANFRFLTEACVGLTYFALDPALFADVLRALDALLAADGSVASTSRSTARPYSAPLRSFDSNAVCQR